MNTAPDVLRAIVAATERVTAVRRQRVPRAIWNGVRLRRRRTAPDSSGCLPPLAG